jgi:hypothetical protein
LRAYDENNFYFATKVADATPDKGTVRMETRDDDSYFYPEVSFEADVNTTLKHQISKAETTAADDVSALQLPDGDGRRRAYYENTAVNRSFAFDLKLPQDKFTQVAVYFAPYDNHEGIGIWSTVTDESGKEIDNRRIERLWKGAYAVYNLKGNVRLRVRPDGGWYTAKVGGLFFDSTQSTSAGFVKLDLDTTGNWKSNYGAAGYHLAGGADKLPQGVTLSMPQEVKAKEHRWPAGVRRYSYRRWPTLPVGHFIPSYDNVQIAFNILGEDAKTTTQSIAGSMPKLLNYHDTDYEYALNKVSDEFGGGTEIWRLLVPGMPRKHFYPRQPKSPFDGAVKDGRLVVTHEGNTRVVEAAIPWSEIPHVRAAMQAGRPVKFSFLVHDAGGGGSMELGRGRSVAKPNYYTFHVDWAEHWSNELEFGWQK